MHIVLREARGRVRVGDGEIMQVMQELSSGISHIAFFSKTESSRKRSNIFAAGIVRRESRREIRIRIEALEPLSLFLHPGHGLLELHGDDSEEIVRWRPCPITIDVPADLGPLNARYRQSANSCDRFNPVKLI